MKEIIIDAKGLILGRLCTFAAKEALLGSAVKIVNCESAVMTGDKHKIFAEFKRKREQGTFKGPNYPRMPDRMVKRTVRGMLPYKHERGRLALKRIICYLGVPEELKGKKTVTIEQADASKLMDVGYVTIQEISKFMGART